MYENKRKKKWATRKIIVSWITTAMLVFSGLSVLLPLSSDVAVGYSMPTGAWWCMDDLVANSSGAVTGVNGTYYVHEDVEISYNSTLIVFPGQTVYFDALTGFKVYGYLSASGSNASKITFTSNATKPGPGDWDGISFNSGSGNIKFVLISYAEYGIYIYDTSLKISNSELTYNKYGVFVYYGHGEIYYCYIANNSLCGIECYGKYGPNNPSTSVKWSEFVSNGFAGIFCAYAISDVNNSSFYSNQHAIIANYSNFEITNSEITSSKLYDFYLDWGAYVTSLNTTFDDDAVYFFSHPTGSPILEVRWYLHILVINASGPVPSADVTVSDNANGTWSKDFKTDAQGRVKWIVVTEYIGYNSGRTYYTPHNITAQKGSEIGYAEPIMDISKWVTVDISPGGPTPNQPPVADAGPDQTVYKDDIVYFDGSGSYDPDGSIVNYTWNFGDGTFGYGEYTTHIYSTTGSYNVTLTVIDDDGATDSDNCIITVEEPPNQPPVADAGLNQTVKEDETAYFDGSGSYDPDGSIVNYTWNFGDGNFGYGESPMHIYDDPGSYTVVLTVTDDDGATDSHDTAVTVEPGPLLPPTDLNAILEPGSLSDVKLTWTASGDDGAGDDDVAGYTVYRSSTGIYGVYEFAAWIPAVKIPGFTYDWRDFGAGDGDWNDYFYVVRANDTSNNEEQNNDRVGKFVSHLEDGWNMISVPLVQSDTKRETVLATIEGNYMTVQGYHAGKSRPWLHWHRNKPNYFNAIIEINHKQGYYIDMIVPDYLVTAGKVADQVNISLKSGWNLVGYPCLTSKLRDDALSSISGKYNMVERYDTTKDREVSLGPDDYMDPGLGYWIHATQECTWTITN